MMLYNKILIKDSTVLGAKTLSSLFNLSGYNVDFVSTNEELLDILNINHTYDLFLYDPGIFYKSDFNFIKEIKNGHYSIPSKKMDIMIMSSSICNGDKAKFIECGVEQFIPKPIKFDNLLQLIEMDNNSNNYQYHGSTNMSLAAASY